VIIVEVLRVKPMSAASVLGMLFDKRIPVASGWPYGVNTSVPPKSSQEASVGGVVITPV